MNIPIKFTTSWHLECNNTASTNVCRLDSSCSVNLFTAIGLICNFTSWKYIYIILRLFVCNFNGPIESQLSSKQQLMMTRSSPPMLYKMYTWASCSGENRNRPTCLQTAGFELLDCIAIKLKRPKVAGGESSDTIRARPKAKKSRRHIYPNVSKNHKIQSENNNKLIQLLWVLEKIE